MLHPLAATAGHRGLCHLQGAGLVEGSLRTPNPLGTLLPPSGPGDLGHGMRRGLEPRAHEGRWRAVPVPQGAWDSREAVPGRGIEEKATSKEEEMESAEEEHHPKWCESDCNCSCDQSCAVHGCGSTREQHGAQACQSAKESVEEEHHV